MTDLFREVEEDLRREQFSKLWEKYGIYVIGLAVAIVLVVAAVVGWRAWSHASRVEASARYDELVAELEEGAAPEEAAAAFDNFAAETGGGYETLARLQQADRLLEAGERDAALAVYEEVANDASLGLVRGMATVRAGLIVVDTARLRRHDGAHGAHHVGRLALAWQCTGASRARRHARRRLDRCRRLRQTHHRQSRFAQWSSRPRPCHSGAGRSPFAATRRRTGGYGDGRLCGSRSHTETSPEIQQTPAAETPAETE